MSAKCGCGGEDDASEATSYRRFGYGAASRAARLQGEKRSMHFRSDIDVGQGTIRLLSRDEARPLIEKVCAHPRHLQRVEVVPGALPGRCLPARYGNGRLHGDMVEGQGSRWRWEIGNRSESPGGWSKVRGRVESATGGRGGRGRSLPGANGAGFR